MWNYFWRKSTVLWRRGLNIRKFHKSITILKKILWKFSCKISGLKNLRRFRKIRGTWFKFKGWKYSKWKKYFHWFLRILVAFRRTRKIWLVSQICWILWIKKLWMETSRNFFMGSRTSWNRRKENFDQYFKFIFFSNYFYIFL